MCRNVQVTLGILAALIEKSPKDVALIAPCVLKILDLILRANDITMIESSLPAFQAFCEHHDASSLFADQDYSSQYESIVRSYAALASTKPPANKGPLSRSVQARWRSAGLRAIKSITTSESLGSVTGRQIDIIMPPILENLWSDDDDFIDVLHQRLHMEEKVDSEKALRRRNSVATVATAGTVDTGGDANPVTFSGSPNDADRLVEEEINILAMQCLKSIFIVPSRPQINGATAALLKFIFAKVGQGQRVLSLGQTSKDDAGWAISIYNTISRWAPVQDRYVILVVAMETLIRNPIKDDKMDQQMTLVAIIDSLLRSDINLIGLSVMDVLLGLLRQMRKLFRPVGSASQGESVTDEKLDGEPDVGSPQWKQLLNRLEQCIGDLATHVYYADQVSDMIAAIIGRLKPPHSSTTNSTPQGEKAEGNDAGPGASVADLTESQSSGDASFSEGKARVYALKVIKAILLVANPKTKISGNMDLLRNRVPLSVWEGTQWLLRDPDGEVRKAYIDAFGTWLDRETTPADLTARDEALVRNRSMVNTRELSSPDPSSRRVFSNSSTRERAPRTGRRSHFLPLLHVAIYDNAVQFVDYETDLTVLHILLTKLVFRLGVNSVRYGLPMVYRLQENIQTMELPVHKVRIAALCHGYFWALSEKFDLEASVVGRAISNEIVRRRSKGFWIEGINIPPPHLRSVDLPGHTGSQPTWDMATLEKEELLPFDDRSSLVECIATSYEERSASPSGSPAASPSRAISNPILGSTMSPTPAGDHDQNFPSSFREQMLTDWSREAVAAALASEGKAESLNGSRSLTVGTTRTKPTINTTGINGNGQAISSPYGSPRNLRPQSARMPDRDRCASMTRLRDASVRSARPPSAAMSSKGGGVASVDQLKMVLSGSMSPQAVGFPVTEDDSGDSMVSYDYTLSEMSFNPATQQSEPPATSGTDTPKRSGSVSKRGPLSLNPPHQSTPNLDEDGEEEAGGHVPPVPPLPNPKSPTSLRSESLSDGVSIHDHASKGLRRKLSSRAGSLRIQQTRISEENPKTMDLQELLGRIDIHSGESGLSNVTKPPY